MKEFELYERNIQEIKNLLSNPKDLTEEEINTLTNVLNVIKSKLELYIIEDILKSNDFVPMITERLDKQIEKYKKVSKQIEAELDKNFIRRTSLISERVQEKLESLTKIKEYVQNYDYKQVFNEVISKNKENEQELIDICAYSLSSSKFEYPVLFNEGTIVESDSFYNKDKNGTLKVPNSKKDFSINEGVLDKAYNLLANKPTLREIKRYISLKELVDAREKKVTKLKQEKEDFEYIKQHIDEFKKIKESFDKDARITSESRTAIIKELKEQILRKNDYYHYLNRNKLMSLINHRKSIALEDEIAELTVKVNKMVDADKLAIALTERVPNKTELDNYLDSSKPLYEIAEQKLRDINNSLLLEDTGYKELKDLRDKAKESLSNESKELVNNNYETCKYVTEMTTAERRNNQSPMVAIFALKTISDAKKTDISKLASSVSNAEEIVNISNYYESIFQEHLKSVAEIYYQSNDNELDRVVDGIDNGYYDIDGNKINGVEEQPVYPSNKTMGYAKLSILVVVTTLISAGILIFGLILAK